MTKQLRRVVLALMVVIAGCGDSGGEDAADTSGTASTADPSCRDVAIDAYNRLDLSGLDPSDGFDDQERSVFESRVEAMTNDAPSLAEDRECSLELETLPEAEIESFVAELRPEVAEALAAAAEQTFSEVGEATE